MKGTDNPENGKIRLGRCHKNDYRPESLLLHQRIPHYNKQFH